MSRYTNQYGNYYDPVGSQANQPSGYSYQATGSSSAYASAPTSSSYGTNYQGYGSNAYGSQQYGTATGQQANSSASHAAQALSSLSGQDYSQTSSSNRQSSSSQYDNSSWMNAGTSSNVYASSNAALPNRTQSNNSPLYSTAQSSSTFGRLSVPEQTQSSSYQNAPSNAGASSRYQSAYSEAQSQQPPRYNSPLHAVQAQQHGHNKQASRGSNTQQSSRSSHQNRQQSASVEPSPTTVDPSQVYDNRAELQRKAQIEVEKRRKYEAEQAAKKAEEERVAEEKRKEEAGKQKAELEAAAKKVEQDRKNEQRRKAREEKKQSKSAASTLAQMATSAAGSSAGPGTDEEAEMRAMFQKMREFNAKNPAMLAKLWDEERKSHEAAKSSPASAAKTPAQQKVPAAASPVSAPSAPAQRGNIQPPARQTPAQAVSPTALKIPQSATGQQPSPAGGQGTTSLWPPHKKGALSEATAKWLMSLPQNAGKSIKPEVVFNILNSNPSYVQLCESLEGFGMKFERSTLARELLKAVPDGLKSQAPPKPATPFTSVSGNAPQINGASTASLDLSKKKGKSKTIDKSATAPGTVNYEAPISLSDAAREVNSMDQPAYQPMYGSPERPQASPYFTQSQPLTNGSRPPSQSQPPEVKLEDKIQEPPRPPADKEEAARKRTFGDLVDLTAEDSDDEGPPAKKIMQLPSAPVNGAPPRSTHLQEPVTFKQFMYNQSGSSIPVPGQGMVYPPRAPNAQMTLPSNIPGQQQPNGGQPPNLQQPPMMQQQPPIRSKGPTLEHLQQARMKGKMLVEPIMRDRVARKSNYDSKTIARDVLLATGRHPDMRGLNAHLATMQKLLAAHGGEFDSGGNRSDLSTIRWDIIDPKPAEKPKDEKVDEGKEIAAARQEPALKTVEYQTPAVQDKGEFKPARRGRPPKSEKARYSLPNPDSATAASSLTNGLGETNTPRQTSASARPATPSSAPAPKANMSGSPAVGYATFGQVGPDGKKKKGRPFGWRKEVHSREAQGLPKAKQHVTKGLPGRPKQSTPASKEQIEPQYQVYKCQWAGCKAELHNLETLKKHLVKVHGKKSKDDGGVYECWWKDCKAQKRQAGSGSKVATFEAIKPWISHVDTEHLQPIVWKLGDGPKGGAVSETSYYYKSDTPPTYLSDSRGRSVTPIITPTQPKAPIPVAPSPSAAPAQDSTPLVRRGRPPKDGIPRTAVQGSSTVKQDPEWKKLEEHLKAVGPTMERMGCILASKERRQTFLDDEDFEDEGFGSEHDPGDE